MELQGPSVTYVTSAGSPPGPNAVTGRVCSELVLITSIAKQTAVLQLRRRSLVVLELSVPWMAGVMMTNSLGREPQMDRVPNPPHGSGVHTSSKSATFWRPSAHDPSNKEELARPLGLRGDRATAQATSLGAETGRIGVERKLKRLRRTRVVARADDAVFKSFHCGELLGGLVAKVCRISRRHEYQLWKRVNATLQNGVELK